MEKVRTILLQQSVFADNDLEAGLLRQKLREQGTYLVNVMSSPGAGKTTALIALIRRLQEKYRVAVMEADIDSDVDAVRVAQKTGCTSIQLHTGGMCHLDAGMTAQGLNELAQVKPDIVFLENVGNLVCPAEFDTGAHLDMTILSVPEGDDKPLKYPLVYEKCGLVLISKIDAAPYFPFDTKTCIRNIRMRNPISTVIPISAKTGENMDQVARWFEEAIERFKANGSGSPVDC